MAAAQAAGGEVLITADHGNCEQMFDPANGQIKRIENPATFITSLKINPIKRGNKIFEKEYNLFYVNLFRTYFITRKNNGE